MRCRPRCLPRRFATLTRIVEDDASHNYRSRAGQFWIGDPIVHYIAGAGANIHEIQMYDRDTEHIFAMLLRTEWPEEQESVAVLRERMNEIGQLKGLSIHTCARRTACDS